MTTTTHPRHAAEIRETGGPARPLTGSSLWHRWKRTRACRKAGGHWWHGGEMWVDDFCCQCGASRPINSDY